jgi:hypothetical protein
MPQIRSAAYKNWRALLYIGNRDSTNTKGNDLLEAITVFI